MESPIVDLRELLKSLSPEIGPGRFTFVRVAAIGDALALSPVGLFVESEGVTAICPEETARRAGVAFDGVFRRITLTVVSSLDSVGLTAAVAGALAGEGISCNMVAAFTHDHVFVPERDADRALNCLIELSERWRNASESNPKNS